MLSSAFNADYAIYDDAEPVPTQTQFECAGCTYSNSNKAKKCKMCNTPKPASAPASQASTLPIPFYFIVIKYV
jgi:hypothetical protein